MILPIYQVDAFSAKRFAGNPAAIVPLTAWISDEVLLQIAQENNLAETAYFVADASGTADFHLRWFTPGGEIDLCGHATLATAYLLRNYLGFTKDEIVFSTQQAGVLRVYAKGDLFELDFPPFELNAIPAPEGLAAILGVSESSIENVYLGRDMVVVVHDESEVYAASPHMDKLMNLSGTGLLLTAAGKDFDVVSRCFYPKMRVNEDPVTGSAHSHLVPLWTKQLGKDTIVCHQASERGGILYCRMVQGRVLMAGAAVLYMHGTIYV